MLKLKPVVIVGAGALARETHSLFHKQRRIIAFLDTPRFSGEEINGCPVVAEPPLNCEFVIAVGDTKKKQLLVEKYRHEKFTSLIHPTAIISDYTHVSDGTIIFPYAVIDPNATLGKHLFMGYHAFIGHHAEIGDYVSLCSYVALSGFTELQEGAYFGTHALTVNECHREHRVIIGRNSIVGAGAVVTKPVPDGVTVVGIPAKPLHS